MHWTGAVPARRRGDRSHAGALTGVPRWCGQDVSLTVRRKRPADLCRALERAMLDRRQALARRAQAMWQEAREVVGRVWRAVLISFPLPAEVKWHESVKLQAILVHTLLEELQQPAGSAASVDLTGRALFVSGKRWIRDHAGTRAAARPDAHALAAALTLAFKSMDISSKVQVSPKGVTVTNTRCPLLEWAKERYVEPAAMCQVFCGESSSFFRGVSYSYPAYVNYRATHMMGRGHPVCKKLFLTR